MSSMRQVRDRITSHSPIYLRPDREFRLHQHHGKLPAAVSPGRRAAHDGDHGEWLNAASYTNQIAPGGLISIFGAGLAIRARQRYRQRTKRACDCGDAVSGECANSPGNRGRLRPVDCYSDQWERTATGCCCLRLRQRYFRSLLHRRRLRIRTTASMRRRIPRSAGDKNPVLEESGEEGDEVTPEELLPLLEPDPDGRSGGPGNHGCDRSRCDQRARWFAGRRSYQRQCIRRRRGPRHPR